MCQLLGMSCQSPANIDFSLQGFTARGGKTDEHKDGWGIGFFRQARWQVYTDANPAAHSPLTTQLQQEKIKSDTVLAHIRKATVGDVSERNCHPFVRTIAGQSWVFAHNGHLPTYAPNLNGAFLPVGDTDSEKAFCWILQQAQARLTQDQLQAEVPSCLFALLHRLCQEIAAEGVFNVLISNGNWLFAFCSTHLSYLQRQYPFAQARLVDLDITLDLNAVNSQDDRMVLLSTKPLTHNEPWVSLNSGEALILQNGIIVQQQTAVQQQAA
ncbi:MAG TPA: class II glutamine amidotransferase [Cellvibrionaceae bacterium]